MREIDSIKKSLADLRELAPEEPECWKTRPPLTEVAVRAIEKKLGFALPPGHRALGIGDELPPNVLMRFGLSDPRNYDSVEMARSLQWFAPLYEPGDEAQTSRREITWEGVQRARDRLRDASVSAVVGAVEPPPGLFDKTEKLGEIWIGWWKTPPLIEGPEGALIRVVEQRPGRLAIEVESDRAGSLIVRETHDAGWRARLDGNDLPIGSYRETFMTLNFPGGKHTILLEYVPFEVILGLFLSPAGVAGLILALTDRPHF